jgi:Acetyl/propionyl-CoA carboxylase, alpha subunit
VNVPAHGGRLAARAAVAIALMITVAACSGTQTPTFPVVEAGAESVEPVAVERRDVVSVVVLEATVRASAEYRLAAPKSGSLTVSVTAGKPVGKGQQIGHVDGTPIVAPEAGSVLEWLVPSGAKVIDGVPVVALRLPGYGLVAQVPQSQVYRVLSGQISARGQITDGPGPFDCPLLPGTPQPGPGVAAVCVIPEDVQAFDGLSGLLALKTAERKRVLTVPVGAVTATSGRGEVWKVVDGVPTRQEVEVGISDGINIEIVSGLAEGDLVLPYSPALRRPQS